MQDMLVKMFCKYCKGYNPKYAVVESTNKEIKSFAHLYQDRDVLVSPYQKKGRGREGKSFLSEKGGAYFSIVYKPKALLPKEALVYVIIAGLAVERTLSELGVKELALKWPNDVLVKDKKIGGILVESIIADTGVEVIVVGIGINVYNEPKLPIMARLVDFCKVDSLEYILAKVVQNVDFFAKYSKKRLLKEYKKRCSTIGKSIVIKKTKEEGIAEDISKEGYLVVKMSNKRINVKAGEISIKE